MKMKRILITGNAGAGKSTLSKRISELTGIQRYCLDKIVWQPGWKETPKDQRDSLIQEVVSKEEWIVDGVSRVAQEAADTVVFLDVPRRVCYWRVVRRNIKYLHRSRPDLPEKCPEILIVPILCRLIWQFPHKVRTLLLDSATNGSGAFQFIHLKDSLDISNFTDLASKVAVPPDHEAGKQASKICNSDFR